jgi:hypothetical protein
MHPRTCPRQRRVQQAGNEAGKLACFGVVDTRHAKMAVLAPAQFDIDHRP